jgi:hypothetical protein
MRGIKGPRGLALCLLCACPVLALCLPCACPVLALCMPCACPVSALFDTSPCVVIRGAQCLYFYSCHKPGCLPKQRKGTPAQMPVLESIGFGSYTEGAPRFDWRVFGLSTLLILRQGASRNNRTPYSVLVKSILQ